MKDTVTYVPRPTWESQRMHATGSWHSIYWLRSGRGSGCESGYSPSPHSGIQTASFSSETHGHEEAEWLSHSISSVWTFVNILNLVSCLSLWLEFDFFSSEVEIQWSSIDKIAAELPAACQRHCKEWKPSIQQTTSDIRRCIFRYTWKMPAGSGHSSGSVLSHQAWNMQAGSGHSSCWLRSDRGSGCMLLFLTLTRIRLRVRTSSLWIQH